MTGKQATFDTMLMHLIELIGPDVNEFAPKGEDAILITPCRNINVEALADSISDAQWFVTRVTVGWIVVEPRYTGVLRPREGEPMFHVSETQFRKSIARDGLVPSQGGKTKMRRTYPLRVHLALNLPAAFQFIEHQCTPQHGSAPASIHTEDKLDLYRVQPPDGTTFFKDVFFPGHGVWCEDSIPFECLEKIDDWQDLRRQYHLLSHGKARPLCADNLDMCR